MPCSDLAMGRARLMADRLETDALMRKAFARSCAYDGDGARPPVGPARAAVDLTTLIEERGDGFKELLTPLGLRTARERLPRILRDMPDGDAKRLVAMRYITVSEVVASAPVCADLMRAGGNAGPSDGGAVWRSAIVTELRAYHQAIGDETALKPMNRRGARQVIRDRALTDLVCIGGMEIRAVLRKHGWGIRHELVEYLARRVKEALGRMCDVPLWLERGA